MFIKTWFTFLMKSEPPKKKQKKVWIMDESKCLTRSEVRKLRGFCEREKTKGLKQDRFSPVRNWFMVELGLNTGLRVNEMATLKHSNLIIEGERSSIFVIGKGKKPRSIWINSEFKTTCQKYFQYQKRFGYRTDPHAFLLNNLSGEKISKRALQKFFKQILKKSDLPLRYHIHCLRHTYATFLLEASNHNYRFVQSQLGHASIKTTGVYAGVIETAGRKAVEKLYKERG